MKPSDRLRRRVQKIVATEPIPRPRPKQQATLGIHLNQRLVFILDV